MKNLCEEDDVALLDMNAIYPFYQLGTRITK